jgi:xylulokinase
MHDNLILTHSLGTNGNLAVVYKEDGSVLSSWFSPYRANYLPQGMVEQDPLDWWKAVCISTQKVLRDVNVKEIAVISFSGQMMGMTCIDKKGEAVRSSLIWADNRARNESSFLREQIDKNLFYEITGHRISSAYTACKLYWLKNNQRELFNKTYKVLQAKDYIVYKLTNEMVSDYSDASGTNLFNINKCEWSRTITSILGISKDLLPDVVSSTTVVGKVTFDAAIQTGLLPNTPVVIGGGDGLTATISGNTNKLNNSYLYYGSSAWIAYKSKNIFLDSERRTFNWNYVSDKEYIPCGTMQTAGISLDWLKDKVALEESSQAQMKSRLPQDLIDERASLSPIGANGVMFLPHLEGERSPYWNPFAKGSFLGLTADVTRSDLFRACYEGVVLNLKIIWNIFKDTINSDSLTMLGGQANSKFNRQLVSDALGVNVHTHNHIRDCKNFGAAILGGVGIGMYEDLNITDKILKITSETTPVTENTEYYDKLLPIYDLAYKSNIEVNKQLSKMNKNK